MKIRKLILAVFIFSGLTAGACEMDNPDFLRRLMFMQYMNGYKQDQFSFQTSLFPIKSFDSFRFVKYNTFSLYRSGLSMQNAGTSVYEYHLRQDAVFCRMEACTQRKYGVMLRVRAGGY